MVFGLFSKPKSLPPSPVVCKIGFTLDDSLVSMIQLVKEVVPFLQGIPGDREAIIDLTRVQYLGPYAAALLLANYLTGRSSAREHRILSPLEAKASSFMHFSGLNHHLFDLPAPDITHPNNVTAPLQVIKEATWNASNPIIDLVHKHAIISEDAEIYLRVCINEVIQNVEDHAESKFGAVYCARYLVRPQEVRIAIVDCGLGIGATLGRRHPEIASAKMAVERAVAGGISANSRPGNQGIGVSNLWSVVTKQLNGRVFIITEDVAGYSDKAGSLRTTSVGTRFAGTGVFFAVPAKSREEAEKDP